jgi:hypothetical protein
MASELVFGFFANGEPSPSSADGSMVSMALPLSFLLPARVRLAGPGVDGPASVSFVVGSAGMGSTLSGL